MISMSASHIDFYYETSLWRLGVVGEEEGGGGELESLRF